MTSTKITQNMELGNTERKAAVAAGGALLLLAIKKWSWPAILPALLGGGLLHCGLTGRLPGWLSTAGDQQAPPTAPVNYRKLTRDQLYKIARNRDIPGRSSMTKSDLIRALQKADSL